MTQYIRMNMTTGQVDHGSVRNGPPVLPNGGMECKGQRWLEIVSNTLSAWQREGAFPATVATNATTIARTVTTLSLADWKTKRIADVRAEQYRRIEALVPLGRFEAMSAKAIRLTFKLAGGNVLTTAENNFMTGFNNQASALIEPIEDAAKTCIDAINAAANHAAVEAAYAAVAWP